MGIPARPEDTDPEAERVQVELLQAAPVARRLRLAISLSATVIRSARRALAAARPGASSEEIDLQFIELHYGKELAAAIRCDLRRRREASPEA